MWPADVLVSPVIPYPRFTDLGPGQLADLYLTVRQIAAPLVKHFNATSLTISIQDGKDAGQSVPSTTCPCVTPIRFLILQHVHVHVLPRKPNDFPRNDDIYQALQEHDQLPNRVYRTEEAMAAEAAEFRTLFYKN
ncbi:unnamed protein product [Echinostoma caproni]|uniref:HIT domain-containing protein n=1 Tax=Echinostoma caproni TaxID=27848 RepID=A0A183AXF8_9TREM|nr:unnamed protein product [Echinostoma caproni]